MSPPFTTTVAPAATSRPSHIRTRSFSPSSARVTAGSRSKRYDCNDKTPEIQVGGHASSSSRYGYHRRAPVPQHMLPDGLHGNGTWLQHPILRRELNLQPISSRSSRTLHDTFPESDQCLSCPRLLYRNYNTLRHTKSLTVSSAVYPVSPSLWVARSPKKLPTFSGRVWFN